MESGRLPRAPVATNHGSLQRMNNGSVTFAGCVVVRRDLVFVSARIARLEREGVGHTKVLRWKAGAFAHFMVDWDTTCLAATAPPQGPPSMTLLSMGPDGDIHVFEGARRRRERIAGPDRIGPLRDMRLIAGEHYAVGMQRQVYRRHGDDDWRSIADGIRNRDGIKGFDSIDGFAADELYAAGLDGELWRFDGRDWRQLEIPVSSALQHVHCDGDGRVHVVGQGGVILRGRHDRWETVGTGGLGADLWGAQTFNGALFVASSDAVHRIGEGAAQRVDIGADGRGAASCLAAGDGVLWSVGERHLAYTSDGTDWTTVDYEDDDC